MSPRARKNHEPDGPPGWLISYSDLMTLLVTFFVLLLSMSSIDASTLARINAHGAGLGHLEGGRAGRVPTRIKLLIELIRDPESILNKQDRIKDLLFPDDILPPELPAGDLKENLRILQHPEGVVIVLTGDLVFKDGSYTLDAPAKKLLEALTPVILAVNADVNISGHADDTPNPTISADTLSGMRALAVLEQFLQGGVAPDRLSVSGYGSDKPFDPEAGGGLRQKNRRVEILLKTTKWLGRYV